MLKRKSKSKKKKKAKSSGNVSTDIETSALDDSNAVNASLNDDAGASAIENSNFTSNHDGNELKNDVMVPKPVLPAADSDLFNFIDGLESLDTVQVGGRN